MCFIEVLYPFVACGRGRIRIERGQKVGERERGWLFSFVAHVNRGRLVVQCGIWLQPIGFVQNCAKLLLYRRDQRLVARCGVTAASRGVIHDGGIVSHCWVRNSGRGSRMACLTIMNQHRFNKNQYNTNRSCYLISHKLIILRSGVRATVY